MGMMANHVKILVCLIRGKMACCSVSHVIPKLAVKLTCIMRPCFFR